jgi:hypothetical protein
MRRTAISRRVIRLGFGIGLCFVYPFASAQPYGKPDAKASPQTGFSMQSEERMRYEDRDAAAFSALQGNAPHDELNRLRLGFLWQQKDGTRLFLQPQYSYGHEAGGAPSPGTYNDLDIHQGYAEVKLSGSKWRLGRQEIVLGDSRLMGNGNWTNIGRSWDAIRVTVSDRTTTTDLFVGKLGQMAGKTSDPLVAGIYSTLTRSKALSYDLYLLYKSVDLTGTTNQVIYTAGTRPRFSFGRGFDGTVEAAYQFGSYASRAVNAYAYAANIGYTFPGRAGLRLAVERDYATGGDPNGAGAYRTFDQLYPTNHIHYGIYDYVGWRNMQAWRISARARAGARWSLTMDGHFFSLADPTDFWYSDGGKPVVGANGKPLRDPTGASGRDLGTEFDMTVDYALLKDLNLQAGYARFMPGDFVRKANGGHADPSDWFYLQTTFNF